jgi:GR25 family glycosyltransferase involved in LPS biosynthesis
MQIGNLNVRAFVVNIQELPERQKFIQSHFQERGIEAENFNGISAALSGLRTVHAYEVDAPGSGWNIGAGPVACWLSFWALWSAWLYMPEPYFFQLEYDARFPENWRQRTESALKVVPPDFDMLFVGSCCTKDKPKVHVGGEVYEVKPLCGHATIIAKKALPVMLRTQRKVYAPIDLSLYFHTLPMLKCYAILPRVADQFKTEIPP